MKIKLVALASVVLTSLLATSASAQTLHLITAAATQDLTIGEGTQASRTAMLSTMSAIANILQLKFVGGTPTVNLIDENFNCSNIRKALTLLSPGKNDIVVFYYAGHGMRTSNEVSPLPTLACNGSQPGLPLQDVVHSLALKSNRLTLVVVDACNFPLEVPQRLSVAALAAPNTEAYRRLFLQTAGLIVLDSSSPGEFSWYTSQGGRFTDQFIATLKNPPAAPAGATWEMFLSKVTEPMVITTTGPVIVPGISQPVLQAGQTALESPQALVRLTAAPQ
jgi:hypothetical protein